MSTSIIILSITILMLLNTTTSSPTSCKCSNPFEGTVQSFIGFPDRVCRSNGVCFVPCGSGCQDEIPSKGDFGSGKCSSAMACDLPGGKKEEEVKFKQVCNGSKCQMTNVINLKITNTQNCLTSDCVQKN